MKKEYEFWVYIVTNPKRTSVYIGVTNDLGRRLKEHFDNRGTQESYAGRYYCYDLVYYEKFEYTDKAIAREKQLKGWSRKKKNFLIERENPNWLSLNKNFEYEE